MFLKKKRITNNWKALYGCGGYLIMYDWVIKKKKKLQTKILFFLFFLFAVLLFLHVFDWLLLRFFLFFCASSSPFLSTNIYHNTIQYNTILLISAKPKYKTSLQFILLHWQKFLLFLCWFRLTRLKIED